MSVPISQFIASPLPPEVYSLDLCVYFSFVNTVICSIFLDSTYEQFYSSWLTSFCMTVSKSIHISENATTLFFFGWVIFHCIYVPHPLYPFLCWWTSRLLPCAGYSKQCYNEHWGVCIFLNYGFLQIYAGSCGHSIFSFVKESPFCSP